MPKQLLTDVSIRALKPCPKQVTYWDASLPGFGCRVSPGGTKTFTLMFGMDRRRHTLGRYPAVSLSTARSEARRLLAARTLGQLGTPSASFAEVLRVYLDTHCRTVRPRTAYDYERLLRRYFLPTFGSKSLSAITVHDITRIVDALSPGEGRHALVILKVFFAWATRRGHVPSDPCAKLRTPRQVARSKTLSNGELGLVLNYARANPSDFNTIILLLILTGQRRSEIGSLRWDWIDFDERLLNIPSSSTKNGRDHSLPLGLCALTLLNQIPRSTVWVFPGRDGGGPFNGWGKCKARFDAHSGVIGWTLHDLRRTFATTHAAIGTPPHIIERLLNHVSGTISGVAAIYNRFQYRNEMRSAVDAYEHHIGKLILP